MFLELIIYHEITPSMEKSFILVRQKIIFEYLFLPKIKKSLKILVYLWYKWSGYFGYFKYPDPDPDLEKSGKYPEYPDPDPDPAASLGVTLRISTATAPYLLARDGLGFTL